MWMSEGRPSHTAQRTTRADSPLERQVKRVAWLIALVAAGAGVVFVPAGVAAGLGWTAAATFAIGLIVANVPEGLLPTITLALAVGVRDLARRGAVVKRLSAVETLGSTTVICTDKTGTLTENRMRVTKVWLPGGEVDLESGSDAAGSPELHVLAYTAAVCISAEPASEALRPAIPFPFIVWGADELRRLWCRHRAHRLSPVHHPHSGFPIRAVTERCT
jgi:magnesium-transporting ATPase (P-type)